MTENKRFTLKYLNEQHISANLYDNKTFIGAIGIGEELIVELLNNLSEENEQLKAQLYCDDEEGVCIICKHHYLEKGNIFYISKCEKGHEECSKEDLRHCKDFEIKESKNE